MATGTRKKSPEQTIRGLKKRAKAAEKSNNLDLATALYCEAALIDPEDEELGENLFYIAQSFITIGRSGSALMIFYILRLLSQEQSIINLPHVLFYSGRELIALGEEERGEALLRLGMEKDTSNTYFMRDYADFLIDRKRYDEGISILENALQYDDRDDEVLANLELIVWAMFKQGNKEGALWFLQDQFDHLGIDEIIDLYLRYARLLDNEAELKALKDLLDHMLELDKARYENDEISENTDKVFSEYLSRSELSSQKLHALIDYLQNNQEIPSDPKTMTDLGQALLKIGFINQALDITYKGIELAPDSLQFYALQAKALVALKDFTTALLTTTQGLEKSSTFYNILLENQGSFEPTSLYALEAAHESGDTLAISELLLAQVDSLTSLGRVDEALESLKKAERLFPSELIFYRYAATLLLKEGKHHEALNHLKAARQADLPFDEPTNDLEKKVQLALKNSG